MKRCIIKFNIIIISTFFFNSCGDSLIIFFKKFNSSSIIVYVDIDSGAASPDGSSWTNAYRSIQNGINKANSFGSGTEVWVADGTYNIYQSDPTDTLLLGPGILLYGGFTGIETLKTQRNWSANQAILDGLNESYHVVTGNIDAVIDGFRIINGRGHGGTAAECRGPALTAWAGPMSISNCIFESNLSNLEAGALDIESSVDIYNCQFINNEACGGSGGAIRIANNSTVNIINSIFTGNTTSHTGGAIRILDNSTVFIEGSTFENNTGAVSAGAIQVNSSIITISRSTYKQNGALDKGGALCNYGSQVEIINSVFYENTSGTTGGAFHLEGGDSTFKYVTIYNNTSTNEGGGIRVVGTTGLNIYNSIIYGNTGDSASDDINNTSWPSSGINIQYCFYGIYLGTIDTQAGNITTGDPSFNSPGTGDFTLQSTSTAIDAGDGRVLPLTDFNGDDRDIDASQPNTGIGPPWVDMGAYEFQ